MLKSQEHFIVVSYSLELQWEEYHDYVAEKGLTCVGGKCGLEGWL